MARTLRYLTHTKIDADPGVGVARWRLSEDGRRRLDPIDWASALEDTSAIYSSAQTRALETAGLLARELDIPLFVRADMREADRGTADFVDPKDFGRIMDDFFAHPEESVMGWEPAANAQERVLASANAAIAEQAEGDLLLVGHGTVGALLYCHWAGVPISGEHRQTEEGGNYFACDLEAARIVHGWQPLEQLGHTS